MSDRKPNRVQVPLYPCVITLYMKRRRANDMNWMENCLSCIIPNGFNTASITIKCKLRNEQKQNEKTEKLKKNDDEVLLCNAKTSDQFFLRFDFYFLAVAIQTKHAQIKSDQWQK